MAIQHRLDKDGRDFRAGENTEAAFERLIKSKGYSVRESTKDEDRLEHFDFTISKGKASYRVEVKGKKRFKIFDRGRKTSEFLLVEFTGVTGHKGWLYGNADLVAFQMANDGFLVVPRKTLVKIAEEKCSPEEVDRRDDMLYKSYGRKDREDRVSAIRVSDIIETNNYQLLR